MENYEKKYKKALERAREELGSGSFDRGTVEYIFPELKESKDDKIRKIISGWIYTRPASFFDNGISKEEMLNWLEKQDEQKPKWTEADEAHLHSVTTHLEQWIECHPNTCGADIQGENLAWLESLKQRLQ